MLAFVLAIALVASACGDDDLREARDDDAVEAPTTPAVDDGGDPETEPDERLAFDQLPHACDLVQADEVTALIGPSEQESVAHRAVDGARYTQCLWDGVEGTRLIVVSVVDTPARHEQHRRILDDFDELEGLGDQALAAPGVSSETLGATGGRTVSVRLGDLSVVVALRLEGVTPVEEVRPLAEAVVSRLG